MSHKWKKRSWYTNAVTTRRRTKETMAMARAPSAEKGNAGVLPPDDWYTALMTATRHANVAGYA